MHTWAWPGRPFHPGAAHRGGGRTLRQLLVLALLLIVSAALAVI